MNDQPLDESGYLYTSPDGTQVEPSTIRFDVVVPDQHLFVMGDNRERSNDSRCHLNDVVQANGPKGENAFVPQDLVVGHAVAVAWPFVTPTALPRPVRLIPFPPARPPPAPNQPQMPPDPRPAVDHPQDNARRRNLQRRPRIGEQVSSSPGRQSSFLKDLLIVVVGAVVVSSLLRVFVGQMFIIPSESMENTLLEGDGWWCRS